MRLLVALLALAPTVALADNMEAEVLFREGKRLIKEGKIAEGCEKLDGSVKLEPSVGSLLNLADCREKNDQLATAWLVFKRAAAEAKRVGNDAQREKEARRRADLLEPKLSYLTINVAQTSRVPGLEVKRDGSTVDTVVWGTGIPIDAGSHEIVASATGYDAWTTKVEVAGTSKKLTVDVPALTKTVDKPVVPDKPQPTEPITTSEPAVPDEQAAPSSFTGMRKAAIAVGVLGVVGIAVGAARGLKANDLNDQANALCPADGCADPMGVSLNADARSAAMQSNIGFIAGGALVAGAVVLWIIGAPAANSTVAFTPSITPTDVVVGLGGRF